MHCRTTRDETGFRSGYPECSSTASEITAKTYFVNTDNMDDRDCLAEREKERERESHVIVGRGSTMTDHSTSGVKLSSRYVEFSVDLHYYVWCH